MIIRNQFGGAARAIIAEPPAPVIPEPTLADVRRANFAKARAALAEKRRLAKEAKNGD